VSALPLIVIDPLDVHARLAQLGLKKNELTGSLRAGASALALCYNTNHPPVFGGFSFWAESVKALRDFKHEDGWMKSDARNYSTVVSPDRTMQIAIARGDEWTGREDAPDGRPSTQHRKGTATQLAVEANHQLSLFDELLAPLRELPDGAIVTWVLLHYLKGHRIKCELSHPTIINSSGFVEAWAERIILADEELDPAKMALPDEPPVAAEVLVRRRA
jgi:hypothetical protein